MKLFNIHRSDSVLQRRRHPRTSEVPFHPVSDVKRISHGGRDLPSRGMKHIAVNSDLGYSARVVFQTEICHAAKTPETCKLIYIDIYRLHIDTSMTHQLHRHHEFEFALSTKVAIMQPGIEHERSARVQGLRRGGKRMTRNSEMTKKDGTRNGMHFSNLASFRMRHTIRYPLLSRRTRQAASIIRQTEMRAARKTVTARSYKPLPRSFSHDLDTPECRV